MEARDPRAALAALVADRGESLAALSRMIGRNDAYLQQFVTRGSPRMLAEADRRVLAAYLGVSEVVLGADEGGATGPVMVPRIDAIASAGPGAPLQHDASAGAEAVDPQLIARLGVGRGDLSIITARGDSMLPTIVDGDEMLVDCGDRRVGDRGGIFVVRLDDGLIVKRVSTGPGGMRLISDNPAYPPIVRRSVDVIGRVVRLSRVLK